jgi:N-methylhydantoinase A
VRIVSLRVSAIGRRPNSIFRRSRRSPPHLPSKVHGACGGWRDTPVWSRLDLPAGATVDGPAILEQPNATTVIDPGLTGRIDALGNLIVEPAR